MIRVGVSAAAAATLLLSSAASAATVQAIQGSVALNSGAGFKRIATPTSAAPGNSVMVRENSTAQVLYEDGCLVDVYPGRLFVIQQTSPCALNVQQGGVTPGGAAVGQIAFDPLVVGGVAVAGGLGVAAYLLLRPASP